MHWEFNTTSETEQAYPFPTHVWLLILKHLKRNDLINLSQVSKFFYKKSNLPSINYLNRTYTTTPLNVVNLQFAFSSEIYPFTDRYIALIAGNKSNNIHIIDIAAIYDNKLEALRVVRTLEKHELKITQIFKNPNTSHLISASWDGMVCIWDWEKGELLKTITFTSPVSSLATHNNKLLICVNNAIHYWNLLNLSFEHTINVGTDENITDALLLTDEKFVIKTHGSKHHYDGFRLCSKSFYENTYFCGKNGGIKQTLAMQYVMCFLPNNHIAQIVGLGILRIMDMQNKTPKKVKDIDLGLSDGNATYKMKYLRQGIVAIYVSAPNRKITEWQLWDIEKEQQITLSVEAGYSLSWKEPIIVPDGSLLMTATVDATKEKTILHFSFPEMQLLSESNGLDEGLEYLNPNTASPL